MSEGQQNMTGGCAGPGETNSEIAGLGIIIAFASQAGLSIFISIASFSLTLTTDIMNVDFEIVKALDRILHKISDIQFFSGISLLVAALTQRNDLSLYHYHVVYDLVNLTGVSYTASLLSVWILKKKEKDDSNDPNDLNDPRIKHSKRLLLKARSALQSRKFYLSVILSPKFFLVIFLLLYVIFVAYFGITLRKWDPHEEGRCYHYDHIASRNSSHPHVDQVYLIVTSIWMIGLLLGCAMLSRSISDHIENVVDLFYLNRMFRYGINPSIVMKSTMWTKFWYLLFWMLRSGTVLSALLQYPLHLYMIIMIRQSNNQFLNGEDENTWGFGQVVALVLLVPVFKEILAEFLEYGEENEATTSKRAAK